MLHELFVNSLVLTAFVIFIISPRYAFVLGIIFFCLLTAFLLTLPFGVFGLLFVYIFLPIGLLVGILASIFFAERFRPLRFSGQRLRWAIFLSLALGVSALIIL